MPSSSPTAHPFPTSTYRLHLTEAFDLNDAEALVGHVDALGADWLYLSPVQQFPAGATHGYHITDPDQVNERLGGREALTSLADALHGRGLGMLLDIVPNHLAASPDNPWWADLLRHGADSTHARTFDVDLSQSAKVVLPVLTRPPEQAVADGEVTLAPAADGQDAAVLVGGGLRLPIAPGTDVTAPLAEVLQGQHYRLMQWQQGQRQINWRRFFAVNELVGVRVEHPEVFDAVHDLIVELVGHGTLDGLRVDHVDGLADPLAYLRRLRTKVGDDTWVVVEKILEVGEPLPADWPVSGTTGYEVATALSAWLLDRDGYDRLRSMFAGRTGIAAPVAADLIDAKLHVLDTLFVAEVETIRTRLAADQTIPPEAVSQALRLLIAHLPGYRTYAPLDGPVPDRHRDTLRATAISAGAERDAEQRQVIGAVAERLLSEEGRPALIRLQQLSGAVAAKAFEDRLLYRHVALSSLCEVGIDAHVLDDPPDPDRVVQQLAARQRDWPLAGSTTSTHDTKRAEDVRARIAVLAEIPEQFIGLLEELEPLGEPPASCAPQHWSHATWLLTQTLLGMLDLEDPDPRSARDRLVDYARKALREADLQTSHDHPDEAFEASVARWIDTVTTPGPAADAVRDVADLIALPGISNALTQVLLKLVGPGVPDIYRGTEIFDASLVDPDNRRPLRPERLVGAMRSLDDALTAATDRAAAVASIRDAWRDGRVKLHVTREALRLRRQHGELLLHGDVRAPRAGGRHAAHVAALHRSLRGHASVVGVGVRLPVGLAGAGWPVADRWGDTHLHLPGIEQVTNILTGTRHQIEDGRLPLRAALSVLPVALLITTPEDTSTQGETDG